MFTQGTYYTFGRSTLFYNLAGAVPKIILALIGAVVVSLLPRWISLGAIATGLSLPANFFAAMTYAGKTIPIYSFIVFLLYVTSLISTVWYRYKSHTFMLDEFSLRVRSGFMSRREVAIPYHQIQDVSTDETYNQRLFGLCQLFVLTAGHEDEDEKTGDESTGVFPLIEKKRATELQNELLKRASGK